MASHASYYHIAFIIIFVLVNISSNIKADNDVRLNKLSNGLSAPTLRFLYCYSCGYRKMFDDYAGIIGEKYPVLIVDGANYDPAGFNLMIARFLGFAKLVVIALLIGGVNIWGYFQLETPGWWHWCVRNKFYSCLMLFFLTNIFEGQLVSTGAFEIFLNDVPVWSKLETGRIPQPAELFQIIDNHMRFSEFGDTTVELKPGFAK